MRHNLIITASLVTFLVGLGFSSRAVAVLTPPTAAVQQGIPYVSGGIGLDERQILRDMGRDYNLKLVFAVKEGNFLSDVQVVIKDSSGHQVLAATSDGPWFYTKLPAGSYSVTAQARHQTRQQVIQVSRQGQVQIVMHWNSPSF